eukprot:CAMPEP_0197024826 /NCGR_PEP_ID=MMETSP1384-20130603/5312_1 /TAXON_ID=29189 /ORGANISM="Ammonia sp." /LENGTH=422 /DNA_ID=CAMNT_0042453281 /DNA_START=78 /DNA_END=1346 /DNA_ORIENTATION=+
MLPKNLRHSTLKLTNQFQHPCTQFQPIQRCLTIAYLSTHSLCATSLHHSHSHRHFSILQQRKQPESESIDDTATSSSSTSNAPSKTNQDPNAVTTGNEKHIEVHAYRSLITIAPEPDQIKLDDLSLSFTERQAAKHQKRTHAKLIEKLDECSANHELDESEENLKSMGKWSPAIAYEIWHSPPEVYDKIYGFEADCEPPDRHNISWKWLYKLWGYYGEREVRYRCALYTYMKAQRRCMNEQFWEVFELENTFRVELQLLCLHIWFAKIRMIDGWGLQKGHKLCYKTFKMFFEQLPNRFGQHLSGSKSRWEQDCQQACLHFAVSLDHAKEDYESGDQQAFSKVIWNELYLSNRDMQHDLLFLWTEYILQELDRMKQVSNNEFLNGWWKFGPIPTAEDRTRVRKRIIDEFEDKDQNDDTILGSQ